MKLNPDLFPERPRIRFEGEFRLPEAPRKPDELPSELDLTLPDGRVVNLKIRPENHG